MSIVDKFFESENPVIKLKPFLNGPMRDYSNYDNVRKIPKLTDGLKDSQRKGLFGITKLCNTGQIKVSQLAEGSSQLTNYLHGGDSLAGAIALMAQDYPGSNNVPIFQKDGQFGSRISSDHAATRYIYVSQHENLHKLFRKEHELCLEYRFDEGEHREPITYFPLIPLWVLNGSIGIGNGYASKIYCRSLDAVKKYIGNVLSGKNMTDKTINQLLTPSFNGYTGLTSGVPDEDSKYVQYGSIERINKNNLVITEVPITYYLDDYKKILNKLIDDKVIKEYSAIASDNNLTFKVEHYRELSEKSDEELMKLFKLVVPLTENVVLFNKDGRLTEYANVKEALNEFIEWRLEEYEKFRIAKIADIEQKIDFARAKKIFIQHWNSTHNVHKHTKEEIVNAINNEIVTKYIDSFMAMPISSLTEAQIKKLEDSILKLEDSLKYYKDSTNTSIYLDDIKEV